MPVDFTFHNVGQGLFYSGKVGDFNFIYDCGSDWKKPARTHLNLVVNDYKNHKLMVPRVDLLILSHLHADHVIGLDMLFSSGVTVDTVILPYLSPIERLMVTLKEIDLPAWFYKFLADPVSFLIEKGVRRIIIIGGREPHSPKPFSSIEERYGNEEEKLDLSEMSDDKILEKEVRKNDEQWKKWLKQRKLLILSHRGPLKAEGIWFFRFFNCKVVDSKLNSFEQCVRSVIGSKDPMSVRNAIKSRSRRKQLKKKCYGNLQQDFNDTSLVVYHAPIAVHQNTASSPDHKFLVCSYPNCSAFLASRFNYYVPEAIGHFLTGDINLNGKWLDIERHYKGYFSKMDVVLVPHHGAKGNWNKNILNVVRQGCTWVASAGISNAHGHPSCRVIQDIIRNGNPLYLSNEVNEVCTNMVLHLR